MGFYSILGSDKSKKNIQPIPLIKMIMTFTVIKVSDEN